MPPWPSVCYNHLQMGKHSLGSGDTLCPCLEGALDMADIQCEHQHPIVPDKSKNTGASC